MLQKTEQTVLGAGAGRGFFRVEDIYDFQNSLKAPINYYFMTKKGLLLGMLCLYISWQIVSVIYYKVLVCVAGMVAVYRLSSMTVSDAFRTEGWWSLFRLFVYTRFLV